MRRSFQAGRALALAAFVIGLMTVEWLRRIEFSNAAIRDLQKDLIDIALLKSTQIPIAIALFIYLVGLLWIMVRNRRRSGIAVGSWKGWGAIDMCKIGLAVFSLVAYLASWGNGAEPGNVNNLQFGIDQTTNGLVLLIGLVTGCAAEWLAGLEAESNRKVRDVFLLAIPFFLAVTSFSHPQIPLLYKYHDVARWTGLWVNPNTYGLLMGVAVILAGGFLITESRKQKIENRKWSAVICLSSLVAVGLCSLGLFKSYSRGAWVATIIGMGYLAIQFAKAESRKQKADTSSIHKNWRPLSVIVLSVAVLAFWQFRFTEWRPARRAFSATNVNDLSWRNRVEAWKGATRMMGDQPLIGFGWGQSGRVYEKKYLPPQVDSGLAIVTNDYFMLGISAGVPALFCFVAYVGLSLKTKSRKQKMEIGDRQDAYPSLNRLQATCRAGGIVLLVGFWFDGGLFKLATGSVFWILFELGRIEPLRNADLPVGPKPISSEKPAEPEIGVPANGAQMTVALCQRSGSEIWLRRLAWAIAAVALMETAVCVGTPFLAVSSGTLAVARKLLIPPKAVGDLNFLATNASWDGVKLRTLLQHASLANYNRELINWKLDDQIYREFVLWPDVYSVQSSKFKVQDQDTSGQETNAPLSTLNHKPSTDLAWRRLLWEYFYPSIRKENDPQSAAEIVLKKLSERVKIVGKGPPTIAEIWKQRTTDDDGFERVYVAALRSVGVPARFNDSAKAELFSDGKWQPAPRPMISEP